MLVAESDRDRRRHIDIIDRVRCARQRRVHPEATPLERLHRRDRILPADELDPLVAYFQQYSSPKIIVDAIFGTGVRLPLSNFHYDVIDFINKEKAYTISLDIPTGVEGNSGTIMGNAIEADLTLAVGFPKLGYYQAEGPRLV